VTTTRRLLTNLGEPLPRKPKALVFPLLPTWRPGLSPYEEAIGQLRDKVDVYGFSAGFGPLRESVFTQHPEISQFLSTADPQEAATEGAIWTRQWLDEAAERYRGLVVLSWAPAMRTWQAALVGASPPPIHVVNVGHKGFGHEDIQQKLLAALGLAKTILPRQ